MPLSTVCVSTVSSRPRTWSSYSNIRAKDVHEIFIMNSTEDIVVYKDPAEPFHSPSLQRRTLGCSYDFPEKSNKKDKKWSISSIFRRKKKEESESTSEEDVQKKGFLGRRRKKSETRKKRNVKPSVPFDHVVLHPGSRNSLSYNGYNYGEDVGVLSDPTAGFSNYIGRALPQIPPSDSGQNFSRESLNQSSNNNLLTGSVDSVRKSRKELTKARAEARRTCSKNGSSSEEESQHSNGSLQIRSEENLKIEKQYSKRTRAARTERYLKRHSRDGENPHNYLRLSKSDVENSPMNWKYSDDSARSPSRSPLVPKSLVSPENNHKLSFSSLNSQSSGLTTIPPSHANNGRYRVSNSTSNPSYKPPQSMNDYNNSIKKHTQKFFPDYRSVSCDANIHKAPSAEFSPEILHVQFPVMRPKRGFRNLSLIDTSQINNLRQPPPPPPRDPNRTYGNQYLDNGRPNTFYFDNSGHTKSKSFNHALHSEQNPRKFNSFNLHPNYRSTSEDQLTRNSLSVQLQCRPSSTTPEFTRSHKLTMPPEETKNPAEEFNYLTDKKPRSRKPIFIKTGNKTTSETNVNKDNSGSQKALNFWKEIDRQNSLNKHLPPKNLRSESPQMFTSHTHVQTKVFLPSAIQTESNSISPSNNKTKLSSSQFSSPKFEVVEVPLKDDVSMLGTVSKEDIKRKSANLEEALHELETIYNSLRLGDEDLLERAEQREKETQMKHLSKDLMDSYPSYTSRGALSDSGFSYEPFDTVDSPRRKRLSKKNKIDLKLDDMAYRKLNKDRANTIADPQSAISQISYLMRSPVFNRNEDEMEQPTTINNEPDITLDDVVYRNVKHSNNLLKVIDPQPPFGIPLGPITPAANSDYLHAKPETIYKPSFKHKKIPDVVKDDLAFRNLRKDSNKGPALPPLTSEDFSNNNSDANLSYFKKKRAQRSMSANIGNILGSGSMSSRNNNGDVENEFKTLTDIADAMEIARRVLKEKENKISATKKAFMSDTDASSYLYPNDTHKENRLNFLNGLRQSTVTFDERVSPRLGDNLSSKPPRGVTPERRRSPKESTPIPVSPLEDKRYMNEDSASSSFDDLLNALAEEAKQTTERITQELKKLSEEKDNENARKANSLNKRLSEIDAVSEQAKKLLENVVDSSELVTLEKNEEEEVKHIDLEPITTESATMVMSRFEHRDQASTKDESEHDYENLSSDKEINLEDGIVSAGMDDRVKSLSPFEEHKAELIASFQELKEKVDEINFPIKRENESKDSELSTKMESIYDNLEIDEVAGFPQTRRPRLSKWLRFCSDGRLLDQRREMTDNQEERNERIARYKEERRRQLAEQFATHHSPSRTTRNVNGYNKDGGSSSNTEGPRPTRASQLRAAAALSQENISSQQVPASKSSEKMSVCDVANSGSEPKLTGSKRIERDKSNKRKSNLNRSLNSEEVPDTNSDIKDRRRRRRFFPTEVLESSLATSGDDRERSDLNATASQSQTSTVSSPITASFSSSSTSKITTPKKSELSVHMENARRGVTPAFSEMGKYKPYANTKRVVTSSPKSSTTRFNADSTQSSNSLPRKSSSPSNTRVIVSDDERTKAIASRMEGLSALTKQTLARVERLTSKTRESPRKDLPRAHESSSSPIKQIDQKMKKKTPERSLLSSMLKKKSVDETPSIVIESSVPASPASGPVSILKRKVSQDEHKQDGSRHSSTHTPPVTFSPNVLEPTTSKRKQGILKKRRSLDESTVMRHRSCSPDVANKADSRSILKNQRRSSLEELRRTRSPETPLQGILKRRTSRHDEDDHSLNSPQSILKRKSGASSAGSTSSTPHVSITTAVILAAAGGAEMVLEPEADAVKPILKKKSFSEEYSHYSDTPVDVPKPILKKKSSTDTDDSEEKPKPILKLPRTSIERDILESNQDFRPFKHTSSSETECEVRPILKQNSREEPVRQRLSFCSEHTNIRDEPRPRTSRRSHTICTDFNVGDFNLDTRERDEMLNKPRPFSVRDLVKSFETDCSTGAIPKRSSLKRNSDRYKTQPITSNELEASRHLVKSPQQFNEDDIKSNFSHTFDVHSLLDFTTSLDNDSNLNSFFSSSLHNQTNTESFTCGKMSSDSAFQSLGDGLELEQDEDSVHESEKEQIKPKSKQPSPLELQMKAVAEEAKKMKLAKDDDEADVCNMSFGDRLKMFNQKIDQTITTNCIKRTRHCRTRFATDSICQTDVDYARSLFVKPSYALEDLHNSEKRSILKNPPEAPAVHHRNGSPPPKKSSLKKFNSFNAPAGRRPILKVETSPDKDDEGISCNDSASSSDSDASSNAAREGAKSDEQSVGKKVGKWSDSTSEGESSGGREVRSIFQNENRLKIKQTLEGVLSKSRSQNSVGNDYSQLSPKKTVTVRRSQTQNEMPQAIADLRAKLQERGESEWKKRVSLNNSASDELKLLKEKNRYNDELSEKSLLASKKDELDAASRHWKSRVEKSDAEKFSVAGKMGEKIKQTIPTINIPAATDSNKRTPQAKRFKLKDGPDSTPTSPEKNSNFDLTRSKSLSYSASLISKTETETSKHVTKSVSVLKPDDDTTFKSFFKSFEHFDNKEQLDVSLEDFDAIKRQPLLVIKKNVQVQRRRGASKNPIKVLAARSDISDEYTEVITGVAEREKKRLNIEKLAKNSNKALEALAGLASTENFKSVALKKSTNPIGWQPWKDVMLLQVKGRRHIQTRLVEPNASSINEGDNYILVTSKALYTYTGAYSNVIEQSRTSDIVNHIQKTGDMGCKVNRVHSISSKDKSKYALEFWKILGADSIPDTVGAGHPDEDETYESNILHTNMIYTLENDELAPYEKYWGTIPKVEMLKDTNIIVFDFGSEMYVWSGKNAVLDRKNLALKLAKEMWFEGYNYSDCNICPLNIASILGERAQESLPLKADKRPEWSLFAKITQHRETVLFREKFLDWPDFSRVIRVRSDENIREVSASIDIKPCDVVEMVKEKDKEPDLIVEKNTHLGRGDSYFDEESSRLFEYESLKIKGWRILENSYEELPEKSLGQFYDADSYIFRWDFRQTVKGRRLGGDPSKHLAVGRDRCIFFCWQGSNSSTNEKGTAAFLTVELDKQNAPQIRVDQGSEPAAFLRLFNGNMIINKGKRDGTEKSDKPSLYILRGEKVNEIYLMEVPLAMSSLRSRSSFVIIDVEGEQVIIWNGIKSTDQKRLVAKRAVENLMKNKPSELNLDQFDEDLDIIELTEGSESEDFFSIIGTEDRNSYYSLQNNEESFDHTMRLFRMSSITGDFVASEVLCPHRSEHSSPYPFVQSELYSSSQPALFLIDNHHELWLWQGYWPEKDDDNDSDLSDQTGSGAVRWQAERKAAMQTAIDYWKQTNGDKPMVGHLVWAGLEPLQFKNMFPAWEDRPDVMELNKKEGKNEGDILSIEKELALLSRTTYPLTELLQRPLPEGVDPTNIEKYLSAEDFQELLAMTKEEFEKLPSWKKTALKKEKGLF
ncbi:supervillin-like isoform X2 [Diabrotica virgifera virgifera]|uniref:HP domain-containing protein n=1 Tax=Diabrotica virgifera virgifera TaxID=50390 RepID=A0ABM5JRM0_DIAVI|nr:supervillin-like isoform X2 [Diabrotica virgifera virgifera]